MSTPDTPAPLSAGEREAVDRASAVFGWQHLVRYSGMSAEWMDSALTAIVRSALTPVTAERDALAERVERALEPFEALAREWDDLALRHFGSMVASYSDPARTCRTAAQMVRGALKKARAALDVSPEADEGER